MFAIQTFAHSERLLAYDGSILASRELLYREFGLLLATERKRRRLTQRQFAELTKLSRTSITNIECGRQPIQLHQLYVFATVLRVDVQKFLPKGTSITEQPTTIEDNKDKYIAEVLKRIKATKSATREIYA